VLTKCIIGGIPDVCDDIGRVQVQTDWNGYFQFLFHTTGDSKWAPNLAYYTGDVWVAADAPGLETKDSIGTLWSQATITRAPQFFGTHQEACSFPVVTSASGWTPGDSVRCDLWAPGGNLLDSTTTTADPNSTVAQAFLQTHGYIGAAWVAADEMGNPSAGPPAPDAEIWHTLNLC
jgi:hypothetical protein